jgi:hypothetical protein
LAVLGKLALFAEAAVHLVRADHQEAWQARRDGAVEQHLRAQHVAADERLA